MYQKILDEAIRELKRTSFKDVFKDEISQQDDFVQDCTIETDLEILIPDHYVEQIAERLVLYTRLDHCRDEDELIRFHDEMQDRFGPIPRCVEDLFKTVRCRKMSVELGFERLTLKQKTLRCYFVNNPDSPYFESALFQSILFHIQTKTNKSHLKQTGKNFLLITEHVESMEHVEVFLNDLKRTVNLRSESATTAL